MTFPQATPAKPLRPIDLRPAISEEIKRRQTMPPAFFNQAASQPEKLTRRPRLISALKA